jgi:drug/metabolite transporter (DMT)-like permease
MDIHDVRSALKRGREQRRGLLTGGERAFAWSLAVVPSLLALGGIALLVWGKGNGHGVGIALLIVALLLMAVPISPLLRARVRRREARAARRP